MITLSSIRLSGSIKSLNPIYSSKVKKESQAKKHLVRQRNLACQAGMD